VFTARPDLGPRIGLRATKMYSLYNGALQAKLLNFEVPPPAAAPTTPASSGGEAFANRLRKNHKHLAKWARRTGVTCWRVYDADLHEYAVAVDIYQSDALHVHVQEYAAPKSVDPVQAEKHLREALSTIAQVLEVPSARIHLRVRQVQKGAAQYDKQAEREEFHLVDEHGCKLWVNFDDYLDTGLFLDHRALRRRLQQECTGKRFLNLFCYTGAATAHAARGGAAQTVSVDLSNTYLEWAQRNLQANDVEAQQLGTFSDRQEQRGRRSPWERHAPHQLVRADCTTWIGEQAALAKPPQFDVIFCDPPTFSNSKRMEGVFDVTRDHPALIRGCAQLLAPEGVLYFSSNRRGFKLDEAALEALVARDITAQTLDEDFRRPPPAHRCWAIRR
jgi:23S rRNA (guanine2445-N2)-methyltransferase / 23S rRNA (guanine2069-N7)-methyltransferase